MHSCRGTRRSANSIAASLPHRSIAASQCQQLRSVAPASQRRSANSVAAWIPRRSGAAAASLPRRSVTASQRQQRRSVATASQRCSRVAASQRQQRRSVAHAASLTASPAPGSVAGSQRRSATTCRPERRSVLASQRRSATRPRERHSATSETHVLAPFAPALLCCCLLLFFPVVDFGWLSLFPPSSPPPACVCGAPGRISLMLINHLKRLGPTVWTLLCLQSPGPL